MATICVFLLFEIFLGISLLPKEESKAKLTHTPDRSLVPGPLAANQSTYPVPWQRPVCSSISLARLLETNINGFLTAPQDPVPSPSAR